MTRGQNKSPTASLVKGFTQIESPAGSPYGPASIRVTASPILQTHVRVEWKLGGRPIAFLQTSLDLEEWAEIATLFGDGFGDYEMDTPRRFWRLRLQD